MKEELIHKPISFFKHRYNFILELNQKYSIKAGLQFPIGRIGRNLKKGRYAQRFDFTKLAYNEQYPYNFYFPVEEKKVSEERKICS